MGRRRKTGRRINGILLLDKPYGISSNAALQQVKRIFRAQKAGHSGSLDPLATGLLAVCFGEATKVSAFLLDTDKRYRAVCKLGEKTTTADAEGEVIERRPVENVDEARIGRVLSDFSGEIQQIPPMYSALKHQGQPLYKLARQGVEIERAPRTVHVYMLEQLGFSGDRLEIEARCSRGTYIRTLVEDIGEALGCGAHISELRRIGIGAYQEKDMVSMERLEEAAEHGMEALDALLLPMETALGHLPDVQLSDDAAYYLRRGQPVLVPHSPTEGWVRLYAREGDGRFMGMGQVLDDGRIAPKRLVNHI